MADGLSWPQRAIAAIQYFFEPLQDVDVYVEDTDDEAFYLAMLKYATSGEVRVARVFGLGGREKVEQHAQKHDFESRRALFVLDGDLRWVRGELEPSLRGVHRHSAYCVENLLVCEEAISQVLTEEIGVTLDKSAELLGFKEWSEGLKASLLALFAAFATANELCPSHPTVSSGVGNLCSAARKGKPSALDPTKVERRRDECLSAVSDVVGGEATERCYKRILQRVCGLSDPLLCVSGKDFVFPLLNMHLQSLGCRVRHAALRARLASCGRRSRFQAVAKALRDAAGGA